MSTTSNMKTLLASTLLAAATLSSYACGPVVPVSPTWEKDVRPLTIARCVRCHDTDAPLEIRGPFSLNHATFAEVNATAGLVNTLKTRLGPALHGPWQRPMTRMPPPPSAALEDWQIEILDNWAFHPQ
jgi:hypothetical protein